MTAHCLRPGSARDATACRTGTRSSSRVGWRASWSPVLFRSTGRSARWFPSAGGGRGGELLVSWMHGGTESDLSQIVADYVQLSNEVREAVHGGALGPRISAKVADR